MSKLLLLFLIGAALYLIFARTSRASTEKRAAPPRDGNMVRCAHCGLHFPAEEGVVADGTSYCCDEHRRLGQG